ncbi:MAG: hypothetical protein INR73_28630 [Williamsia sp.]|nr:hypothetical protein [Williamsia sp.]
MTTDAKKDLFKSVLSQPAAPIETKVVPIAPPVEAKHINGYIPPDWFRMLHQIKMDEDVPLTEQFNEAIRDYLIKKGYSIK